MVQAADPTFPANIARRSFTLKVLDGTLPSFFVSAPSSSVLPFANVATPLVIDFATTGAVGAVTWTLDAAITCRRA